MITLTLSSSGIAQLDPGQVPQYFDELPAALREAAQTKKKIILYTGTAHHLRTSSPREYFFRHFAEPNVAVRHAIKDWLVCEQFVLEPMSKSGRNNPDYQKQMAARFDPLHAKYDIRFLTPTITLLAEDGRKIAGPFQPSDLPSLARHLEPPQVANATVVAKSKPFAIFAGQDIDAAERADRRLVALTPFLTVTNYYYLGEELQFELKELALDKFEDQGRFHVVIIYASGRFKPQLPPGHSPVLLLDGKFFRAGSGRIDPADMTTRGVGVVPVTPGDDWISISIDNKDQLESLTKELLQLKALPR
ncbi:hypothetical protein FEM03_10815 [Phragmitibacter flavus]|uniref:Uncharacterized protein n=1 Tax=Phragmitibacter flavus TaxID=2576071 RepID=A0A5R8KES4_9BACT|nr:hypothetical protein [Phragmitibacter flavus]TLD70792.1 hypothetical protein FEM03_10815 [Phragmitibacter flavus]